MEWTEPKPPTLGESYYDHTTCSTPIGVFKIEWKSWKENPGYCLLLNGDYIINADTLDEAKGYSVKYLTARFDELKNFLLSKPLEPKRP